MTYHEIRKVNGKIQALTAQGKAQGVIIGLAPFVILLIFHLMSPEYVKVMFTTVYGNIILGVIVVLQTIAFFIIQKIVKIKV